MRLRFAAVALVATVPTVLTGTPADSAVRTVPGTQCAMFPANNYWHADIRKLKVHPRSAAWKSHMSPTRRLHPDFGPSGGVPYGIPITVVPGTHAKVPVTFTYADYRADTKVVLQAMKRHGLVLADNGSPWYFQGTQDTRWPTGLLDQLKSIPASAFEAVDTAPLIVSTGSGRARRL